VSSETLLKSAKFSVKIIISRSAPTDFSVKTAAGFAGVNKINVYSGADGLINA
jgi:formate dehydrogenase assembly factor FdhD